MPKVLWLETASHMVKLDAESMLDGMRNGNSANPAVHSAPVMAKDEPKKAKAERLLLAAKSAKTPPAIPTIGAMRVSGYCA